jgi:hypothetical protein
MQNAEEKQERLENKKSAISHERGKEAGID